jgi:hypothetical protein
MGASRQSYCLWNRKGRKFYFLETVRSIKKNWKFDRTTILDDNLMPLYCAIAGHQGYQTDIVVDATEWACHKCHRYIKNPKTK